jgi:deazaflavin-dependent oxidoreductase (nitroreductase family)
MPLPDWLARSNRRVLNPLVRRVAGRLPWFAIVANTGRTSGRQYRTPVNAFRTPDGFVIALTYGPDTDWLRNVLAAGGATLEHRGHQIPVTEPRLVHGAEVRRRVPLLVRLALRILKVDDFVIVREKRRI